MDTLATREGGKNETGRSGLAYLGARYIAVSNKSRALNEEEVENRVWMGN